MKFSKKINVEERTHRCHDFDTKSHVWFSVSDEVETAYVFVHGFNGSNFNTWRGLANYVDGGDDWLESDLYFVRYKSIFSKVAESTSDVHDWIEDRVFGSKPWSQRSIENPYKRVILVGHSEGGLILRNLVLRLLKEDKEYPLLLSKNLKLFAPALGGVSFTPWYSMLLRSPLRQLSGSIYEHAARITAPFFDKEQDRTLSQRR